jgi:hypothetical protein
LSSDNHREESLRPYSQLNLFRKPIPHTVRQPHGKALLQTSGEFLAMPFACSHLPVNVTTAPHNHIHQRSGPAKPKRV